MKKIISIMVVFIMVWVEIILPITYAQSELSESYSDTSNNSDVLGGISDSIEDFENQGHDSEDNDDALVTGPEEGDFDNYENEDLGNDGINIDGKVIMPVNDGTGDSINLNEENLDLENMNQLENGDLVENNEEGENDDILGNLGLEKNENGLKLQDGETQNFTISFDTDGGTIKDSIVVTGGLSEKKYNAKISHTHNVDDEGNADEVYANNFGINDVVTITGAERLHIQLDYATERNRDYLYVFKGIYNKTPTKAMSDGQLYTFNSDPSGTRNKTGFYIDGDTVTFSFFSDTSNGYYGYYAIIMDGDKYSAGASFVEKNFDLGEDPVRQGKVFVGWYKKNGEKWNSFDDVVDSDITLYAHWRDPEAILLPGKDFNTKIKNLANGWTESSNYGKTDNKIEKIQRAESIPLGESTIIISDDTSDVLVYAWYDNGVIYYYSDVDKIYANIDSSYMFGYMYALTDVDVEGLDTSRVIDMSYMFANCYSLQYLALDGWNLSKAPSMGSMFTNCNALNYLSLKNLVIPSSFQSMLGCRTTSLCSYIDTIDVSNWNLENTISLNGLFGDSRVKQIIGLDTWNTSNLNDISNLFSSSSNCRLTGLDLSNWDTSNVTSMSYIFSCPSLEWLNLDGWNFLRGGNNSSSFLSNTSSLKKLSARGWKIPESFQSVIFRTWAGGVALEELDVSNWDLENARNIYGLFGSNGSYGQKLTTIKGINTWKNTENIVNIGNMFNGLSSLQEIDMSNMDLSAVTSMSDSMFGSCNKLRKVDMHNTDISSVTNLSSLFGGLSSLQEIDMSNMDLSSVTSVSSMFGGCSSLKEINMSNTDVSMLTNMNGLFNGGLNALITVNLNNMVTTNLNQAYSMFANCYSLKEVSMDNWDLRNLQGGNGGLNGLFSSCYALNKISAKGWKIPSDFMNGVGRNWSASSSPLKVIDVTNWDLSGTNNINGLFADSPSLKQIIGLDTWNTKNIKGMNQLFYNLPSLTYFDVSKFDTSSVEDISMMFFGLKQITGLDLSHFTTDNVKNMNNMFNGDTKLEYLNLDGWNWLNVVDNGGAMFYNTNLKKVSMKNRVIPERFVGMLGCRTTQLCSYIDTIDVSNWNLGNTIGLDGLFGDSKVKQVIGLDTWDTSGVTSMANMFENAIMLSGLDLSSWNTENVTNMSNMFKNDRELETIYVSDKFKTTNLLSGDFMFSGTVNIKGGNGTLYDSEKINQEYARIDIQGISGYFTNILDKVYTITYNLNGGILSGENASKYTLRDTFTLINPTRNGYKFLGWTGTNISQIQKDVEILLGTKGDLEFTANWEFIPEKKVEPVRYSGGGGGGGGGSSKNISTGDVHGSADEMNNNFEENQNEEKNKDIKEVKETQNIEDSLKIRDDGVINKGSNDSVLEAEYSQEQIEAYSFAKSKGITTTSTIQKAKMNTELTRIEMAKMLSYYAMNVLGQEPDAEKGVVKFNDVSDKLDKQYDNGVTLAYQLGIMGINMKNNKFRPNDGVTRAEFATALSRMLYNTEDGKGTSKYYEPHMAKLYNEGIITNTNPKLKEKRGYVMTMLMRSVGK